MGKKTRSANKKKSSASNSCGGKRKAKSGAAAAANPFGTSETAQTNDTFQSIYHVYKAATTRFKEQLTNLIPAKKFNLDFVKSFLDAADYIKDNDISIDHSILRNLRLAISVRKKYSENILDGGDEGHSYFLLVLNYCLQVLRQCKIAEQKTEEHSKKDDENDINNSDAFCNRFDALSMLEDYHEGDSDSEEEDGDSTDSGPDRPEPPSKEYSYDDLLYFPDRAKCLFFFETMAFLAHESTLGLRNLKETMRMEARGEYPTDRVPVEIMCQGIFANSMIRSIQDLENDMYVECPDLKESPYRVLVCCFMSPMINMLSDSVRTSSPHAKKWNDDFALAFWADVVEAVFRCRVRQIESIADRFTQRWKMPNRDKIRWLAYLTMRMVMKNAGTKAEIEMYRWPPCEHTDPLLDCSDAWLREDLQDKLWESINGENSILNTMKIVDGFGSTMCESNDEFYKIMAQTWNRNVWKDSKNPASSIRGDLDSTLISMMMHVTQCKWRFDGEALPMEKQMLPLVSLIREGSEFESKPSFALIFAVHCMLMSIFELQGDGDIFRIRDLAKNSFDRFMSQAGEHLTLDIPCHSEREGCLKFITDMKRVTEMSDDADFAKAAPILSQEHFDLLIWNPMSAGMLMSYTNVYLSLQGGFIAMTTSLDLTAILHIYNALKYHELVDVDLPLLADIDRYFDKSKCIWNGWDKPQQGKFVYRLHLSMGATNEMAVYAQDKARFNHGGGEKPANRPTATLSKMERTRKTSKRFSTTIEPSDIALSFKRYCLHDFKDTGKEVEGPLHKPLKLESNNLLPIPWKIHYKHTRLIFASIVSDFESRLLKYNMVAVGTVISQFLYETFSPDSIENIERFEAKVKASRFPSSDHTGNLRSLVNCSLADEILACLDYDPDKFAYLGDAFEQFFYNLDMNRVCIFEDD